MDLLQVLPPSFDLAMFQPTRFSKGFIRLYMELNATAVDLSVATSQRRHKKMSAQAEFEYPAIE